MGDINVDMSSLNESSTNYHDANELFSIVSSSFPLLRIHVVHKNAVSGYNRSGRVRHTSDPISSYFVLAHSECGHAIYRCFFTCREPVLLLPNIT